YAQGCVHRLRGGAAEPAAVLGALEEISREALRAAEIIRRVRTLVRKEEPRRDRLDVAALVRDATRIVVPAASRHGVAVQVAGDEPLPPVYGDGIQIEQVVINLLLNGLDAILAHGPHGERELLVRTAPAGDEIEVTVRDTGVGIPSADVFAPFFSTKPGGLGMGLSISRSIIEAHGGHLAGARNPDRGSTFRFTLPTSPPD
ncbi:MAG: sensor histidine kinase, partial [Candidatus Binatia bacterium]